jgi:NAD(P)H-nitrite reductase large subunit
VGAELCGEASDAAFYLDLMASGRDVSAERAWLPFGPAFRDAA